MVKADAIVLFGVQATADGRTDDELVSRAREAAACYRAGFAPVIFASGGGEPVSEARAARELLLRFGVPESAVLMDEDARFTIDTAKNAARAFGRGARVVAVTSDYHAPRARKLLAEQGLCVSVRAVKPAPSRALRHRRRLEPLYRLDAALGWHDGTRPRPKWLERFYWKLFPQK